MKRIALILLVLSVFYASFFSEKARLDREVNRLCAIDGGIKVYEMVTLPVDKFNEKYGQINFLRPTQGENRLGSEYIYQSNFYDYKKGDPAINGANETAMRRDHIKIIRKLDMKLLGEVVMYHRAGGDMPGPWMPSSHHCPSVSVANEVILMSEIFTPEVQGIKSE